MTQLPIFPILLHSLSLICGAFTVADTQGRASCQCSSVCHVVNKPAEILHHWGTSVTSSPAGKVHFLLDIS